MNKIKPVKSTTTPQAQFSEVLTQIQTAKRQAYRQINKSLVELYWNIGKYISSQVKTSSWGKGVVEELAIFIKNKEPNLKGFSARNMWLMKQFFDIYQGDKKLQTLSAELSWSQNCRIMSLKIIEEREFYLILCNQKRYSFRELERLIKTSTFERTMLTDKNISTAIKQLPQSIDKVFKDSYVFEFLDLPINHKEKDLQNGLVASLKDFILELGNGFSFISQEYRLQVGTDDFFIDLLFFHRGLQCLVAFEIKNDKFKPEHLGQLNFYLEALDNDVKLPNENPSIGILLCREKNDEVVKYALNRNISPTLVADYETKLIPKELLRCKLNEFYQLLDNQDNQDYEK
jgi:predicted nuclease of restriction endonuclease-like (RecB) superfamily